MKFGLDEIWMEFAQLVEHKRRNIFLKKHSENRTVKLQGLIRDENKWLPQ